MGVTVALHRGAKILLPPVAEGVQLTWERRGTAGKLTCSLLGGAAEEGDGISLEVDGEPMFFGFVFAQSDDGGGAVKLTAYDQIRYLKNKDTIAAEGLKASDMLRKIGNDFQLNLGEIEDTGYIFETIVEENTALLDMVQNALDDTLRQTGRLFVLYDDCGKLTLKNITSMRTNLLICEETAENYNLTTSIDENTYTKIKLSYDNEDSGKRELFIAQSGENINKWGVLQYFEEIQSSEGAAEKANALLKLYGDKSCGLRVKGAAGDCRVRGGSAVFVQMKVGNEEISQYFVVNKVVHCFDGGGNHQMDLDLIGGDFFD